MLKGDGLILIHVFAVLGSEGFFVSDMETFPFQ